jgi:transcription elongation factor GreA
MEGEQTRILTMTDKRNLERELAELQIAKQRVAEDIKTARSHGDLSENAEYTEAKNAEARVYGRLQEVEMLLKTASFVDDSKLSTDVVSVGTVVKVFDLEYEEEDRYTIVGFTESDPAKLFISSESPIGRALIGAKVGDTVEANTPGGVVKLKVLAIDLR